MPLNTIVNNNDFSDPTGTPRDFTGGGGSASGGSGNGTDDERKWEASELGSRLAAASGHRGAYGNQMWGGMFAPAVDPFADMEWNTRAQQYQNYNDFLANNPSWGMGEGENSTYSPLAIPEGYDFGSLVADDTNLGDLLRGLGYEGEFQMEDPKYLQSIVGAGGEGNGRSEMQYVLTPEFQRWAQDNNLSVRSGWAPDSMQNIGLNALFRGDERISNPWLAESKEAKQIDTLFWTMASMMLGGALGGAAAGTAGAASGSTASAMASAAASSAISHYGNSGLSDGWGALKAGAMGAASAGLTNGLDVGGYLSDNEFLKQMVNKGVQGGLSSAMKGGNILQGAGMGALQGGVGGMFDSFFSSPSTDSTEWWNQGSSSSIGNYPMDNGDFGPLMGSGLGGGSAGGDMTFSNMGVGDMFGGGIGNFDYSNNYDMPTGGQPAQQGQQQQGDWRQYLRKNGGNILSTLGKAYLQMRQAKELGRTRSNLDSLYSGNSPYAKQLQETLARRDAAAGRRSQYGTRATELAAQLSQARNQQLLSPQYQNLIRGSTIGYGGMMAPLMQLYGGGAFDGLGGALSSGYDDLIRLFGG